jgi:GTP-binding protein
VSADPYDVLECGFLIDARDASALPVDPVPEVAFAGRSNVGKSTLLNCVVQRHGLARTSRTPGCTRGLVLFHVGLRNGTTLRVMDLPGYGFAERTRGEKKSWGPMIEGYLNSRDPLHAVVILVDARRGPEDEERQLIEYLDSLNRAWLVVVTKIDKLSKAERFPRLQAIAKELGAPAGKVLGVSGESGEGRRDLLVRLDRIARAATETQRALEATEAP